MITRDQIPPDAMYAAWKAMNAGMTLNDAIAAALSAWPGVVLYPPDVLDDTINPTRIILPLPQEASDE